MMLYISMKFHENILNDFQIIERARSRDGGTEGLTDGQKDRQPRQKQYVSTSVFSDEKVSYLGVVDHISSPLILTTNEILIWPKYTS